MRLIPLHTRPPQITQLTHQSSHSTDYPPPPPRLARRDVLHPSMELFAAAEEKPCRLFRKRSGGGGGSGKAGMGAVRGDDGSGGGKGRSFSGRCARLVKEQRARFYIMRRCVTMLVCWREYA